jgi:hypothetical protein
MGLSFWQKIVVAFEMIDFFQTENNFLKMNLKPEISGFIAEEGFNVPVVEMELARKLQ